MTITARTCLKCGTRHWSTQPCPAEDKPKAERARKAVEAVTESKMITKLPEVITKPKTGRKPIGAEAMSGYQRLKRYRDRKKAGNGNQTEPKIAG
jgi:hypothetical protein